MPQRCHRPVGGQSYQKFGLTQDYWLQTSSKPNDVRKSIDKGRFQDTKIEADSFMFKVQQLRNVAVTPPYFHGGSVAKRRRRGAHHGAAAARSRAQ